MRHPVTLIPGDGIGPEVAAATREVLEATGVAFDWDEQASGAAVLDAEGIGEALVVVRLGDEIAAIGRRSFAALARCGLKIDHDPDKAVVTTPADFNRLFPATGGALYGRALVVENRSGSGGHIGAEATAKAAPLAGR